MSTYGSVPITLFGATSTDAQAVAIALHELGLEFNVKFVDLFKQEQKEVDALLNRSRSAIAEGSCQAGPSPGLVPKD